MDMFSFLKNINQLVHLGYLHFLHTYFNNAKILRKDVEIVGLQQRPQLLNKLKISLRYKRHDHKNYIKQTCAKQTKKNDISVNKGYLPQRDLLIKQIKGKSVGAEEMAQQLRALTVLPENPHDGSQPTSTPVPQDPTASAGLIKQQPYKWCTDITKHLFT